MVLVRGQQPQVRPAKPRQERRLLDAAVALIAGVDDERRLAALQSLAVLGVVAGPLPGTEEGGEGGRAGGVVDDAGERVWQAHHLAQPVHDDLFHLGGRGARLPAHALAAEARGDDIRQDGGVAGVGREVGEERGMVPVGDARHHHPLQFAHDALETVALGGRCGGQERLHLAWLHRAHHRPLFQSLAVVRHPIHQGMSQLSKGHCIHGPPRAPGSRRSNHPVNRYDPYGSIRIIRTICCLTWSPYAVSRLRPRC